MKLHEYHKEKHGMQHSLEFLQEAHVPKTRETEKRVLFERKRLVHGRPGEMCERPLAIFMDNCSSLLRTLWESGERSGSYFAVANCQTALLANDARRCVRRRSSGSSPLGKWLLHTGSPQTHACCNHLMAPFETTSHACPFPIHEYSQGFCVRRWHLQGSTHTNINFWALTPPENLSQE